MYRARFANGVLKPLDPGWLTEGDEVLCVKVSSLPAVISEASDKSCDAIRMTAGGWIGHGDAEELIRSIYEARELGSHADSDSPAL